MQDGELVPKHSHFQLFDIIRAPTPERQRQDAAKEEIAERSTEPPTRSQMRCIFYGSFSPEHPQSPVGQPHTSGRNFCTFHAHD